MNGPVFTYFAEWPISLALVIGMLVLLEVGRRAGVRQRRTFGEGYDQGVPTVEGSVFALLGLLIAFSFSGAAERFDHRRELIVEEANDIGTAYLRVDLLPPEYQPPMRALFRDYLDARLAFYHDLRSEMDLTNLRKADSIQTEIWALAVKGGQAAPTTATSMLLLGALNTMFDITTTRTWAMQTHPPTVVLTMLCVLALCGALLAGYSMSAAPERNWLHQMTFAFLMAGAIYVIIDLEYPRRGLIRVDAFDQALVDVRTRMQ